MTIKTLYDIINLPLMLDMLTSNCFYLKKEILVALIEFKNVEKYYGDYHALRNINLEIEKGQVVVLLGPSGSGKSTLIRTMNALESI